MNRGITPVTAPAHWAQSDRTENPQHRQITNEYVFVFDLVPKDGVLCVSLSIEYNIPTMNFAHSTGHLARILFLHFPLFTDCI